MKRISALLVASFFALGLIGCGSSNEDKAEKMVSAMENLGNIIEKNKGNCPKMTEEVKKFAEANKKTFEEAKNTKSTEEENKKMMEKYGKRIEAVMPKMAGLGECPDAAAAMPEM